MNNVTPRKYFFFMLLMAGIFVGFVGLAILA
jgi:hypothetical protein